MTNALSAWPLWIVLGWPGPPVAPAVLENAAFRLVVSKHCRTDPLELEQLLVANLHRVSTRLGADPAESPAGSVPREIRVYGSHEEKGLATGSVESLSMSTDGELLELVVDEPLSPLGGRAEALLVLSERFGPTDSELLREGAQLCFAASDTVREYRAWAAWIATAGEATPVQKLLDPDHFQERSFRVQAPLAAVVVEYGEFLVHHALLAEQAGCEWLCIGSELVMTTQHHSEEWAALARRARKLFSGGLTYSANWGSERDSFGVARELDAVGVDCYESLSTLDQPTDAQLRVRAGEILSELAAHQSEFQRPMILAEIGYPSRLKAWDAPHRSGRERALSPEDQARSLAAFFEAFRYQTENGVRGFYLWKWPTFDSWPMDGTGDYWPASERALELIERALRS